VEGKDVKGGRKEGSGGRKKWDGWKDGWKELLSPKNPDEKGDF
jgi:hypothetical protein